MKCGGAKNEPRPCNNLKDVQEASSLWSAKRVWKKSLKNCVRSSSASKLETNGRRAQDLLREKQNITIKDDWNSYCKKGQKDSTAFMTTTSKLWAGSRRSLHQPIKANLFLTSFELLRALNTLENPLVPSLTTLNNLYRQYQDVWTEACVCIYGINEPIMCQHYWYHAIADLTRPPWLTRRLFLRTSHWWRKSEPVQRHYSLRASLLAQDASLTTMISCSARLRMLGKGR